MFKYTTLFISRYKKRKNRRYSVYLTVYFYFRKHKKPLIFIMHYEMQFAGGGGGGGGGVVMYFIGLILNICHVIKNKKKFKYTTLLRGLRNRILNVPHYIFNHYNLLLFGCVFIKIVDVLSFSLEWSSIFRKVEINP